MGQLMNQESMLMQELGVDEQTARQILSNRQLQDTRILQKVNRAHREAFSERYPGQVEHCLRLVMERLQAGLDKRGGVDVAKPDTWIISASEIAYLVEAAQGLDQIRRQAPPPEV
jgi:hypothetical protein